MLKNRPNINANLPNLPIFFSSLVLLLKLKYQLILTGTGKYLKMKKLKHKCWP